MNKVTRKLFSERDDANLKKFVKKFGENWELISDKIKKFSPRQCKDRYTVYLSGDFRNDPWTEEEDQRLSKLYHEYGPKWCEICKFFDGRHSNSVKNRWHRYIKPKELAKMSETSATSPETIENTANTSTNNQLTCIPKAQEMQPTPTQAAQEQQAEPKEKDIFAPLVEVTDAMPLKDDDSNAFNNLLEIDPAFFEEQQDFSLFFL